MGGLRGQALMASALTSTNTPPGLLEKIDQLVDSLCAAIWQFQIFKAVFEIAIFLMLEQAVPDHLHIGGKQRKNHQLHGIGRLVG